MLSKLPQGANDDEIAAGGWANTGAVVKIGPDYDLPPKPDFVQRENEEAYRDGWR